MGLEVRSVPPRFLLAVALASLLSPQTPAISQENKAVTQAAGAAEAKAQLLQELDQQIEQRRQEIAREEEALGALKHALEAARQALAEERDRLAALKRDIEADIGRRQAVVDQRLTQIAKVYGAMKPREAAAALESMDDGMATDILERLPGRTVAKIFDVMPKDRVRELTQRLEGSRVGKGE